MKPGDLIKFRDVTTLWRTPLNDSVNDDDLLDVDQDIVGLIVSMLVDPGGLGGVAAHHILVLTDATLGWTDTSYVERA